MISHKSQQHQVNRLIHESSPYLLQHAYNPVDWYPWGREAFDKAQREDRPVFLSIGYSTCHWCHVMAHESFEDRQIASILNEHFVPIKVDREERPDVDSIYMDIVQAITGSGGWPLSVFLTPQGKPFYCGTYFPPTDIGGRLGLYNVLMSIHEAWLGRHEDLRHCSEQITARIANLLYHKTEEDIPADTLQKAYDSLRQAFDDKGGGFGRAPKFPMTSALSFLLVYYYRTRRPQALNMVEWTLYRMASGGIYDHLGGGFHRYSVDQNWLVPHFEKMLYDQALLSRIYAKSYQVTGKPTYARTAEDILRYTLRDMMNPSGGFYSAQDADSEGREGCFYLWDYDEILANLGQEKGQIFTRYYGVNPEGILDVKNILHIDSSIEAVSADTGLSACAVEEILSESRNILFQLRNKRIHPSRDEKIITAWNGLMISSLAASGAIVGESHYIQAARQTADFILQNLLVQNRLRRSWAMGKAGEPAFLEDYAFLIEGLIDLYEADFNPAWLSNAVNLANQMIDLFEDPLHGGFFFYGKDAEQLIIRPKSGFDGAIPSGNSAAAMSLMRLAGLTGNNKYFEHGFKTIRLFSKAMQNQPMAMTEMLIAADFALGPRREVVIAGLQHNQDTGRIMDMVHSIFMPRTVVLLSADGSKNTALEKINPSIHLQQPIHGKSAVYLCENFTCGKPLTDLSEIERALESAPQKS